MPSYAQTSTIACLHMNTEVGMRKFMQSVLTARLGRTSLTADSLGTQMQRGEATLAADVSIVAHLQVLRRGSERGEAAPVWRPALGWGQSPVRSWVGWAGTGAGARPGLTAQSRHLQQ